MPDRVSKNLIKDEIIPKLWERMKESDGVILSI